MLKIQAAFSSISVDDLAKARKFYKEILGLSCKENGMGLTINLPHWRVFLYPKEDHQPATFTVLNFEVGDIDKAVDGLAARGVTFERYEGMPADDKGIVRDKRGPEIAWFKDPAGNILAVIQKDRADKPWFRRRLYHWGWKPVTWQGWLITFVYVGILLGFASTIDANSPPREIAFTFLLPVILTTVVFFRLAYRKGYLRQDDPV